MGRTVLTQLKSHDGLSGLVGVDPDEQARSKAAAFGGVKIVNQPSAVWADPEVGVVFIASPNSMHADLAIQAKRAGKAVLLEKPIAGTLSDAEAVVSEASRTGSFLQMEPCRG